jgi:hypothetical protein
VRGVGVCEEGESESVCVRVREVMCVMIGTGL